MTLSGFLGALGNVVVSSAGRRRVRPRRSRSPFLIKALHFAVLLCLVFSGVARASTNAVRGADEIFWAPTMEQALDMARATGKPLFLMGYSLVGDGSTYTKVADDYCTGVF